ncbi:MAG: hypothetical protein ACJ73D_03790 [Pyrinomonadaceae bacterium]
MRQPRAIVGLFVAAAFFVLACSSFGQTSRAWTAPKAGVWAVKAKDEEGTKWSGRLHLERRSARGPRIRYRGYFYWISGDHATSGNEYFSGRFDRRSGRLWLHGYRARSIHGELGTGNYRASGRRGRQLLRGTWSGQDSIPGTWSAKWKSAR